MNIRRFCKSILEFPAKIVFSGFSEKPDPGSRLIGLKPSRDQDGAVGANKKSLAKSVQPFRSY